MWYNLPWTHQLAFFCLVCFPVVCLLGIAAWSISCDIIGDWWAGGNYTYSTTADKSYNKGVSEQTANHTATDATGKAKPKVNKWFGRTVVKPPHATFFGRFDGKNVYKTGDYEDKWLTTANLRRWNRKKGSILMAETPIGSKIAKTLNSKADTATKDDNDPLLAGNGVRNPHLTSFMGNFGHNTPAKPFKAVQTTVVVFWDVERGGWYLDNNIVVLKEELTSSVNTKGHWIGEISMSTETRLRKKFMHWEK